MVGGAVVTEHGHGKRSTEHGKRSADRDLAYETQNEEVRNYNRKPGRQQPSHYANFSNDLLPPLPVTEQNCKDQLYADRAEYQRLVKVI